ncbi:hypothetical protein GCM10011519_33220 [Marmoricola endophyticus]|uniref:Uncharacterized protein n=1 Tax=Marmoricola endophyticus TaxID=2040280 RepID=A0A917BVY0_9ACTN|nr:hypothetical protein [Marmoricola endophyticus]GGF56672.1 hypothetical protein GCM10011519_33220 [Marmoricola endophyticus]
MRLPHENVATVLVAPSVLGDLELELMGHDLWLWRVATAPFVVDGQRRAFQVRRRLLMAKRGEWDLAADWVPVWISFGPRWYDAKDPEAPLPWSAHEVLWGLLARYPDSTRYRLGLGGVPRLRVPTEGDREDGSQRAR